MFQEGISLYQEEQEKVLKVSRHYIIAGESGALFAGLFEYIDILLSGTMKGTGIIMCK